MIKRIIFLIVFFYLLALLQVSFLAHLPIFGLTLNFSLFFVAIINIIEPPDKKMGIFCALIAGFYLDIFQFAFAGFFNFFGFNTLLSLLLALAIKAFLKSYIRTTK